MLFTRRVSRESLIGRRPSVEVDYLRCPTQQHAISNKYHQQDSNRTKAYRNRMPYDSIIITAAQKDKGIRVAAAGGELALEPNAVWIC